MYIPRLYVEADLAPGEDVPALPGQGHYLAQVMRKAEGDSVHLFNGRHGEWQARIGALRKDKAVFVPEQRLRPQAMAADIRLLLAPLKRDAMEWVVEKATELGVASIHLVLTARGVVGRVNEARLAAIAREAAEQCERLDLPAIAPPRDLHRALDAWDGTPILLGHERGAAPPLPRLAAGRSLPLALLVGPEGGFTAQELEALARRCFVSSAALGPRILRAETAAVAGLAVLQASVGDWTVPS